MKYAHAVNHVFLNSTLTIIKAFGFSDEKSHQ